MEICSEQAALASPKIETHEQLPGRGIPGTGVGQVREAKGECSFEQQRLGGQQQPLSQLVCALGS